MDAAQILLIALLAVPAVGAVAVLAVPARRDRAARVLATGLAGVTFLLTLALPVAAPREFGWFSYGPVPALIPWVRVQADWVPSLGLQFHLGVDAISYPLVVLTGLLTVLCCAYTVKKVPEGGAGRTLAALLLVLEVGVLGTFLALDLILFFIFFEVVLLPMFAVIAGWGGPERRAAARKFVLYTLAGSVLLLIGVVTVVSQTGSGDLTGSFDLSRNTQCLVFALLAVAFAIKAPLWPLHTWLPDAHTEAPTVGSVILAGVLLKMGTYGLIRVGLGVAPQGAEWASPVLGVLAVVAIIAGSLICLRQRELKRLIAYSSVGHMGFVLLGIATLTVTGIQAALIGNVAHGLITGLLFFLVGTIKDRTGTGSLDQLSGLREQAPRLAGLLGFAAIASLGLPGLAGFWGEAFAVVAAVQAGGPFWVTLAVIAACGGALTAAYFLRLLRRVTHGPSTPGVRASRHSISLVEWVAWGPLVVLSLVIGLMPALVLSGTDIPIVSLIGARP
ncbi:NADH-quinone oxidoreductase subunit M [Actinoplanes lutulentus]|uniref:NADH dehydrogenase subunit M n=1 Tax=Actinoplanes lutulentus TaxID=1287878 RepID=A0A327ZGR5_9ACTN|nr:NADH-quinone oxidoreductase subunit M [Actinoplanes lutulentus]MBB2945320.1 NADH-quinone oxidoreductase subunit M [Actinoplanes lutulentus]RAK40545.1 NADH dehydrogenase subunit M [Actinoplanes lutulentus]